MLRVIASVRANASNTCRPTIWATLKRMADPAGLVYRLGDLIKTHVMAETFAAHPSGFALSIAPASAV